MSRNERKMCVMYLNTNSGFEVIHGVLDLIMVKIGASDYYLRESDDPMYFPKRGAHIVLNGKTIGSIGVLHPDVLTSFHLKYPVTCFELSVEDLFAHFKTV